MSINLQLDVPALERLLGGDSEVEVKLRQGVVEEFAKRHLCCVLKDDMFKEFLAEQARIIRMGIEVLTRDHVGKIESGKWPHMGDTFHMTAPIHEAIQREAERQVGETIRKTVEEKWKTMYEEHVLSIVVRQIGALTADHVNKLVKERLAKVALEVVK